MALKPTTQLIAWLSVWSALVLVSEPLFAEEAVKDRSSKSISYSNSVELDKAAKDSALKETELDTMEPLLKEGFRLESTVMAAHIVTTDTVSHGDFSIYDASTTLISDLNYDGYYHRFSVTFDADTVYETAYVYARLYVSYEGGPWNHYASSDNYHINGDSDLDSFTVETELADGFPPGYYDVRIELYNADNGAYLLSYGPYDDASLSGLPLEDSYYDDQYGDSGHYIETEVAVSAHGGSMSWWLLLLPLMIVLTRQATAGFARIQQ